MDNTGENGQGSLSGVGPADVLLSTIVELSDDAVITCDATATITYFSQNAERLVGRASREVVHRPVGILFPSHLSTEMNEVFATVAAGERIRRFETEIVRADGLPIPVSLSLAPLIDREGAILGSVVVARDVTEQHLAQATLAEIDARLEEGEAITHVGSWLWDVRTGAVQWSAEFHRINGIDPLEFAGTFESFMDWIDPEDRASVRAAMIDSVHTSRPLDLEYRVAHPDLKTHVVRVHASPTLGSDGRAVGLRGVGHDVSDQAGSTADALAQP